MSGSTFGKAFQISTFGESHGKGIGVIIQGCPAGLKIHESDIQKALDKRKPGSGIAGTTRKEPDKAQFLSGVFEGRTTGTPLMIYIQNKDARSKSYESIARLFRPGHGDYAYQKKYGIRDYRGGGRSSARETAARVAAGAVAQLVLDKAGIEIQAFTLGIGGVFAQEISDLSNIHDNPFLCPDPDTACKIEERVKAVKQQGDSLGGIVQIHAINVPPGLGDPVFDKLDADIAKGLMSIGAVKAVEIGAGIAVSEMTGYENNDQLHPHGFETNHSGGILAGISNGDDIVARVHIKPIPSILKEQKTIDLEGRSTTISTKGRHDISAIPRVNKVCESMMALVLADHLLRQRAIENFI